MSPGLLVVFQVGVVVAVLVKLAAWLSPRRPPLSVPLVQSTLAAACPAIPVVPFHNISYTHGGFLGAATFFLQDERWLRILKVLCPDDHAALINVLQKGGCTLTATARMLENNPVLCAFGLVQRLSSTAEDTHAPVPAVPFEWDVYVNVEAAALYENAETSTELECARGLLLDTLLIAHGTPIHILYERCLKVPAYSILLKRGYATGGGDLAKRWGTLLAASLECYEDERLLRRLEAQPTFSPCTLETRSLKEVGRTLSRVCKGQPFHVVLDVKSVSITARVLCGVLEGLADEEVTVVKAGTFSIPLFHAFVRESALRFTGRQEHLAKTATLFFHTYVDLLLVESWPSSQAPLSVFINGGCLMIRNSWIAHKNSRVQRRPAVLAALREHKGRLGYHLGVYLQEYDLDATAAHELSIILRDEAELFDGGLAWGGLPNVTCGSVRAGWGSKTLGLGGQEYAGWIVVAGNLTSSFKKIPKLVRIALSRA